MTNQTGTCSECGAPAKMRCPTCVKLCLPDSLFCTQDCFKKAWGSHKKIHLMIEQARQAVGSSQKGESGSKLPEMFAGYQFTGNLRPGIVGPRRQVPDHIPRPDYALNAHGRCLAEERIKKSTAIEVHSPETIENIRECCRLAREVLDIAGSALKVGMTTDEVDAIVHDAIIERNAYPSPLGYYGFPKSCCTSVNEVICHGIPDSRPLRDGDICNVDITLYYKGVHGDLNETFLIGDVDEDSKKLVDVAYNALEKAITLVKPGTLYRSVGNVISKYVHSQGCSVVRSYCGHGIGKLFHTNPNVPHYANNKAVGVMKPGHVFTIEPMINRGTYHDKRWPDDWTAVTKDGKRSAQFEHTLLVTDTGCEVLTKRTKGSYLNRQVV